MKPFRIVPGDRSPLGRARLSLEGLSVGDAFGERFFVSPSLVESLIDSRAIPAPPWYWTDDTAMALSIFEHLRERGSIDQEPLAQSFATRYRRDPRRGYGGTAHSILTAISLGEPWREAAGSAFDGQGSMGNGGGMRSAPIGGYFADDLAAVVAHARASAEPTHAHPDGQAGAIAVAVAAALAWKIGAGQLEAANFLREVVGFTPAGATRDGIEKAVALPLSYDVRTAVAALGNGSQVISSDTVPFALWCAARHIENFEEALYGSSVARFSSGFAGRRSSVSPTTGFSQSRTYRIWWSRSAVGRRRISWFRASVCTRRRRRRCRGSA